MLSLLQKGGDFVHERIKKLRKALNLTQQEFATKLNIGRGTLANYEVGRNEPIDAVISLICREFNVNEQWLRTGEGEMFNQPQSRKEEIQHMVERMMEGRKAEFKYRLISVLNRLDEDQWEVLEDYLSQILAGRDTPPAAPQMSTADLAAEVTELKRQNQLMAAKIAAMEEEDAAREAAAELSVFHLASDGRSSK